MKKLDQISGGFLLVLGGAICIESYRVSLGGVHEPGPGFFPFLTGLIISILSFVLLVQASSNAKLEPLTQVTIWEERNQLPRLLWSILALVAYGFFLEILGFILCTLLYIGFQGKAIARMRWPTAILLALLSSFGSYIVFQVILKTELPKGFIGI
jgi:putative tricarboxylic transport membrane protein